MENLISLFVPYNLALKLKALGFDEPCFGYYNYNGSELFNYKPRTAKKNLTKAPIFSQAFKWFESKNYRNYIASNKFRGKVNYWFAINPPNELMYNDTVGRNSKEEAELACLEKLIEIVEKKEL